MHRTLDEHYQISKSKMNITMYNISMYNINMYNISIYNISMYNISMYYFDANTSNTTLLTSKHDKVDDNLQMVQVDSTLKSL